MTTSSERKSCADAAVGALAAYCVRRQSGGAESLGTWLGANAPLADDLEELLFAPLLEPDADGTAELPIANRGGATDHRRPLVDGFHLIEQVGEGSHGSVWRARRLESRNVATEGRQDDATEGDAPDGDLPDGNTPEEVAIKILHGEALRNGDLRARFEREANAASKLSHPALCRVIAWDTEGRLPWLAMEFLRGETLADYLEARGQAVAGETEIAEFCAWAETLANALYTAHSCGLVHRDVKPANIMITARGPVLVDFGLVRDVATAGQLTVTSDRLGTPTYMAPEQTTGGHVDQRADVWALGVTLYECLAGVPPFRAPTHERLGRAIRNERAAPLRQRNPQVSPSLDCVVNMALAKDPQDRYATAAALAEDLARWRTGTAVLAREPGRWRRSVRWCRNSRLAAGLIGALFLAVMASLWFATRMGEFADEARKHAARVSAQELSRRAEAADSAFVAGRLAASYGRWQTALRQYAQAETLGRSHVESELGRIEVWDATFRADRSRSAIAQLLARDDLGRHRSMVELFHHDFSRRDVAEEGGKRLAIAQRQMMALRQSPNLSSAWRAYVHAITAETMPEVQTHLRRVLREDRRHRAANEMWIPITLLLDGPTAAAEAARQFGALYPEDSVPAFLEAFAFECMGSTEAARARVAEVNLPPSARTCLGIARGIRDLAVRTFGDVVQQKLRSQLEARGRPALDTLGHLHGLMRAVSRSQSSGDAANSGALFRLPFCAAKGIALTTGAFLLPFGRDQTLVRALRIVPLRELLALRGAHRCEAGAFDAGLTDLDTAVGGASLFGVDHELAMLRLAYLAQRFRAAQDDAPGDPVTTTLRTRTAQALAAIRSSGREFNSLELRFLARVAGTLGSLWGAREFAMGLARRRAPDAASAAVQVELLRQTQLADAALEAVAAAQKRWPGDARLAAIRREIDHASAKSRTAGSGRSPEPP